MQATLSGVNVFLEYISWLKGLNFNVEYVRESDDTVSGHVSELCAIDNAPTLEECKNKLVSTMREISDFL